MSGVDPPLCCSRVCLHTAFIGIAVHCVFAGQTSSILFQWRCSLSSLNGVRAFIALVSSDSEIYRRGTLFCGLSLGCGVHTVSHAGRAVLGVYGVLA